MQSAPKLDLSPHPLRPAYSLRERARLYVFPALLFLAILSITVVLDQIYTHPTNVVGHYFKTAGLVIGLIAAFTLFQVMSYRETLRQRRAGNEMVLRALNEISAATVQPHARMVDLLARLAHLFADVLQMNSCLVTLYARKRSEVVVRYAYGSAWQADVLRVALQDSLLHRRCYESGEIFYLSNADDQDANYPRPFLIAGMKSFMLVPIVVEGLPVGSILLADPNPNRVGQAEARRARVWISQTAVMVSHRRLIRKLRKSADTQRRLLLRTRRMYEFSEGIYQATTLAESLHKITQLGPRVLQVDHVVVVLRDKLADHQSLKIAATSYVDAADLVGEIDDFRGKYLDRAMTSREIVETSDTLTDPNVSTQLSERWKSRSVIYAPLSASAGAAVIGALVLLRNRPGQFSRATRRLALSFATRAAAAIENARLLEQTRLDADTKKHLLRELNHRVKNNLAGIVGLLSVHPPGISDEVRQWIDRVTQRIVAMSRAHELLLNAGSDASLNSLIREIMQLSITDRSRVRAVLDDYLPEARIPSGQALALAMILHELCDNANVYGLLNGGTLRVCIAKACEGSVSVTVEDLPVQDLESSSEAKLHSVPRRRSGVGLELVEALVSRELRGNFALTNNNAGGKSARVEFPLLKHTTVRAQAPQPSSPLL